MWVDGRIDGVLSRSLVQHRDDRGWLAELFRIDDLASEFHPQMAYTSMTRPGVIRGPHEHREQSDLFAFLGPSNFRIYLWDNRRNSPTYGSLERIECGEEAPVVILVPPGVVHAYKNIGSIDGLVINFPNRLYGGHGRSEAPDEIRHELDPASPFLIKD